jgi:Holliday junction DNA helicase RuvA
VLERRPTAAAWDVLVEVGGVGYRVLAPTSAGPLVDAGTPVVFHVHTHVRDDAIILYGFPTRDERECFEILIGVHSVGPALALAILSTHGPAALRRIVAEEDADAMTMVPGVGKKTAVRLLLELRTKLHVDVGDDDGLSLLAMVGGTGAGESGAARADVRAALAGLGYGADEVREAVRGLPADGEVSDLVRVALKQLAQAR